MQGESNVLSSDLVILSLEVLSWHKIVCVNYQEVGLSRELGQNIKSYFLLSEKTTE